MAMELSAPRVSFSASPTFSGSSFRLDVDSLPVDPPSAEFDFSTSYEAASTLKEDSSSSCTPADLLFSQGRLLPLHNTCTTQLRAPHQAPKPNNTTSCSSKQVNLLVGRSSSVSSSSSSSSKNKTAAGGSAACQLIPRSKSTGWNLNQNLHPSKSRRQLDLARTTTSRFWKSPSESSSSSSSGTSAAKAYYYSGDRRVSYGIGVRINPVINVPAPFIPRGGSSGSSNSSSAGAGGSAGGRSRSSFFAYLLCSCRDKNMEPGVNF